MLQIKTVIISKIFISSQEEKEVVARELVNNGYKVYMYFNQDLFTFSKFDSENVSGFIIEPKQTLLESYFSCIVDSGCSSEECIIVDDNVDNIQIAKMTGCKICFNGSHPTENDPENLNALDIIKTIIYYQNENSGIVKRTMFRKRINIIIPMMGSGLRLHSKMNKDTQKAYMDIMGKPMISWVIQNLKIDANYIFIIRSDSNIDKLLLSLVPKCTIVRCEHKTEGQIGSILLAEKYINNNDPLIIANDNQWLDWDIEKMLNIFLFEKVDSLLELITFISDGNHRYNYVELDDNNMYHGLKRRIYVGFTSNQSRNFLQGKINTFNLNNIKILKERYQCTVGFSDHSLDNTIAFASIIAGAELVEKHVGFQYCGCDLSHRDSCDSNGVSALPNSSQTSTRKFGYTCGF